MLTLATAPLTYFQAIVIGLLQGFTELFPISSLGHAVLVPELLGWDSLVKGQSADNSFYLAFLVGLHCATAIALLIFYRHDWVRVIRGFFTSIRKRRLDTVDERMAWLLVVGDRPRRHRRVDLREQSPHRVRQTHRRPRSSSPSTG